MLTNAAERESAWLFFARAATLQAIHRNEVRVEVDPGNRTKR
jgi:hypothetical protein